VIGDAEELAMTKVLNKVANLLATEIADGVSFATSGEGRQPAPHGELQY
jgi:pyruvate-formate lyase